MVQLWCTCRTKTKSWAQFETSVDSTSRKPIYFWVLPFTCSTACVSWVRGGVIGSGIMTQALWPRVRFPTRSLDFSIDLIPLSPTMDLGSTQPLTEMSVKNLIGGKGRPVCKGDNLSAICGADCLENVGASTPRNPMGFHGLLQVHLCLFFCLCESIFWHILYLVINDIVSQWGLCAIFYLSPSATHQRGTCCIVRRNRNLRLTVQCRRNKLQTPQQYDGSRYCSGSPAREIASSQNIDKYNFWN
jgi:hypothetical protein